MARYDNTSGSATFTTGTTSNAASYGTRLYNPVTCDCGTEYYPERLGQRHCSNCQRDYEDLINQLVSKEQQSLATLYKRGKKQGLITPARNYR